MMTLPLHMNRSPLAPATAAAVVALLLSTLGSTTASSTSTSSTTTGAAFVSTTSAARGGGADRVFLPPGSVSAPTGETTDRGSSSVIVGYDHPWRRRRGFWGYAAGEEETTVSAGIGTPLRASSSSSALNYVNDDDNNEAQRQHMKEVGDTHGMRERHRIAPNGGRVTLVGAGPGSPDLLTVAAHRILTGEEGEVGNDGTRTPKKLIIADRLVSDEILDLCRNAEIRVARKYPGCAEKAQEEIYRWAEEGLRDGRHVVRLKIGDPFVFGRGGEEVLKFREEMGMEPRVVPGVSAAFSAPLLGGIPVTHRGVSNQVVMCTGYGRNGTSPDLIRYHEEQTVVFLMAVGRLRQLCDNLVDMAGYPRDTPVGIVERAGCPDQRTLVGTMDTIGDLAEEHGIRAPSTIVVGEVVGVLMEDLRCDEEGDAMTTPVQGLVRALNVTSLV